MSDTRNLLVELFVEELPPKALKKLGDAFAQDIWLKLADNALVDSTFKVVYGQSLVAFASPRRLAVWVKDVLTRAPDRLVRQKLMPVAVALDAAGNATPALLKKLSAMGIDASVVSQLRRESDGKADVLFYDSVARGACLADGLQKAIEAAIAALPIPKVMTYQLADGWTTVNFVRPAHGLLALHGTEIIPVELLGLKAGRATHGHRFEAAVDPLVIADADRYAETLARDGAVIASFAARRGEIEKQLQVAAIKAGDGLTPIADEALLDEVTALVERPNVLIGQFEDAFLEVPQECLILTMKANQKYFPLLDAGGKLSNKFLIVSNISPDDPGAVIGGNERVVRPRLADAKFFFDQDRKKTLESRLPGLAKVVYHNKLYSQGERTQIVAAIASKIAAMLDGKELEVAASTAATLAKTDLLTDMVGEFPELQGIMGRYYALHDGFSEEIADAIEDHYKPRFAGDTLPRSLTGLAVALADKLETLVGLFSIGQLPTGDKDPFALRRHALGIIRMLVENDLHLQLDSLLRVSIEAIHSEELQKAWAKKIHDQAVAEAQARSTGGVFSVGSGYTSRRIDPELEKNLANFIYERLSGLLREQGYSAQEVDAVVSLRPQRLGDIAKRLAAVRAFAALPEAAALAAANKRIGNILKKADAVPVAFVQAGLLSEPAEVALHRALGEVTPQADAAFSRGDYAGSLLALAILKAPVDTFFNEVMVNADDPQLRANRLGLLATLHQAMNQVADLSRLSA